MAAQGRDEYDPPGRMGTPCALVTEERASEREVHVPHFLFKVKYTAAAVKALIANPQDREKAAATVFQASGGKLHGFYMAFGHDDVIAIAELPDAVTAAAASMVLGGSGAMSAVETVPLLTAGEAMAAMRKAQGMQGGYKAPS